MSKFYICEKQALTYYIDKRKSIDKIKSDNSNSYNIDFWGRMEQKAAEMNNILSTSQDGKVAILKIEGVLVERKPDVFDAYFDQKVCSYSTVNKSISEIIDRNIKEVEVYFNTPGGEVSGVEDCREYMQLLNEYANVNSIIIDSCCSGGVWLASGLGKLPIALNRLSCIGSIGVASSFLDTSEMFSNFGIEEITLTNDQSPDKRPDIKTLNGQKIIIEQLNAIYNVFRDNVSTGFGIDSKKIDDLKGKVLYADDAVKYGLVQSIGKKSINSNNNKPTEQQLQATPETQTAINPETPVENIKQEDNMTLQELLASNPDAKAEYDIVLESAKAEERKEASMNAAEILKYEDVVLSQSAAKALGDGTPVEKYAMQKLAEEKAKREQTAQASANPFQTLTAKQTPAAQAPAVAEENTSDEPISPEEIQAKAKATADAFFGGK
jgi:ClpP class serine protease